MPDDFEWDENPNFHPGLFSIEFRTEPEEGEEDDGGGEGEVVGELTAAEWWVYADTPGAEEFSLENKWKLSEDGIGGKLLPDTTYHLTFSPPDEELSESDLSGYAEEDCEKVTTGSIEDEKIPVKLPGKAVNVPLGEDHETEVKKGELGRIWLPSERGGCLTVDDEGSGGELELYAESLDEVHEAHQKRDDQALPEGDPEPVKKEGRLKAFLAEGDGGWFHVLPKGDAKLSVTFYDEGIPRDADDSPLFPYHFYYWPVKVTDAWEGENAVFRRYAKAFEKDVDETIWWEMGGKPCIQDGHQDGHEEVVERAKDGEYEDQDTGHYRPSQPGWAGHCHNSAPASMIFEPAEPGASHGGHSFAQKDCDLLHTEFFGNYGSIRNQWRLPRKMVMLKLEKKLDDGTTRTVRPRPPNLLKFVKPADDDPASGLGAAIEEQYSFWGDIVNADEQAEKIVEDHGGAEAFNEAMQERFVGVCLDFVDSMYDCLADKQEPCMGDIRSNQEDGGPSAIWNNCAMYVRTLYEQAEEEGDPKDVRLTCEIFFNIDNVNAIGDPGCTVTGDGEVEPKNYWGRRLVMRAVHSDVGKVETDHEKTEVESFHFHMRGRGFDDEVFMISYLARPSSSIRSSRKPGDDFGGGNPYVDRTPLDEGFFTLRKRYA